MLGGGAAVHPAESEASVYRPCEARAREDVRNTTIAPGAPLRGAGGRVSRQAERRRDAAAWWRFHASSVSGPCAGRSGRGNIRRRLPFSLSVYVRGAPSVPWRCGPPGLIRAQQGPSPCCAMNCQSTAQAFAPTGLSIDGPSTQGVRAARAGRDGGRPVDGGRAGGFRRVPYPRRAPCVGRRGVRDGCRHAGCPGRSCTGGDWGWWRVVVARTCVSPGLWTDPAEPGGRVSCPCRYPVAAFGRRSPGGVPVLSSSVLLAARCSRSMGLGALASPYHYQICLGGIKPRWAAPRRGLPRRRPRGRRRR